MSLPVVLLATSDRKRGYALLKNLSGKSLARGLLRLGNHLSFFHDHFLTWTTSTVAFFCEGIRSQTRTILTTRAWRRICAITPSIAMTSTTSYGTLSPITPLRVPAIIWKNIIWHGRFLSAMDALVCNHYGILYFGCVT